jgi:hypothetical protein
MVLAGRETMSPWPPAMSLQHPVSLCRPVSLRRPPMKLRHPPVTLRRPPVSLRHPPVTLRHPPVSLRRSWSLRRSPTVIAKSKPVVVVSTVTRLARRPSAGCPPWSSERRRPETHSRPVGSRRPCRKQQAEPGTGTEAEWTTKEYLSPEAEVAAAAAVEARLSG